MNLYVSYLKVLFKSQLEYRTSFLLLSVGQFFVPFTVFITIYLLFQRFEQIAGWTLYEVALCYSIVHIGFSISECFARGFDSFSSLVIRGEFDRILVRPRTTFLQVIGSQFEFTRIGRLSQSIIVLIYALQNINIEWNFYKVLTFVFMIASAIIIFTGIYILGATLCFFTIEGLEFFNIFTDGGREITQYPLSIYKEWFKKFFTYVVPFGTVNYLPLMYLLNKGNLTYKSWVYMITPLYGFVFIIPCIFIWNFGVRHYKSTGS